MKKSLLFGFACLTITTMYAQNTSFLYGKWQIINTGENESDFLKIKDEKTIHWGHFIEFHPDRTFHEQASAPCGLDDNRFSYYGKWSYDSTSKTIKLNEIQEITPRPNIYRTYKVLSSGIIELLSIRPSTLKTKIISPWEKIADKKN